MNSKLIVKLIIIASLLGNFFIAPIPAAFASSFNMTQSTGQVTPGGSFTVTIIANECAGRVNFSVSGGSTPAPVWVENNSATVTITAGGSGNVVVVATPESGFSDDNGDPYSPGSRSATVAIVAPAPAPTPAPQSSNTARPSTPAASGNTTSNNNSSDNDADKPADQPTDDTPKDETKPDAQSLDSQKDQSAPADSATEPAKPGFQLDLGQFFHSASQSLALAWILAWSFFALFLLILAALVYILFRHHKDQPLLPKNLAAAITKFQKSPTLKTLSEKTPTQSSKQPKSPKAPHAQKS